MGLVLGILILLLIGLRISNEQLGQAEARREYADLQQRDTDAMAWWLAKVTNKELEENIRTKISERDPETIDRLRTIWDNYFEAEKSADINWGMPDYGYTLRTGKQTLAEHVGVIIMMADNGLLTENMATRGFQISTGKITDAERRRDIAQQRHFVEAINRGLRRAGIREEMYINPPGAAHVVPFSKSTITGVVKWSPMVYGIELQTCERKWKNQPTISSR